MTEALLAGESWMSLEVELKGRNFIADSTYTEAGDYLIALLESAGAEVTYQPCHVAATEFPRTVEAFQEYDLVVLSDVGAETLQITQTVADGTPDVDRLAALAQFVHDGGALGMIGGYMSFAGQGGSARYGATPVGKVLPVEIARHDDRIETPSGALPERTGTWDGADEFPETWPAILGYNQFVAESDAEVWARVEEDPFLVVGDEGDGSVFAFASDCAPHWAPMDFLEWDHLPTLWDHLLDRVATT